MVEKSKPATLSDVARLAGVSVATASKALNGRAQVRASTREKVFRSAEALSFIPNPLAQGLLSYTTGQCSNPNAPTPDLAPVGSVPNTDWYTETLRTRIRHYALADNPDNIPAPACTFQGPVTADARTTTYPQLGPNVTPPPLKLGG